MSAATAMPETLSRAAISILDEDRSPLSERIAGAFYPPFFLPPEQIAQAEMDARMDAGRDTFGLDIPPGFQRDLLAGRRPSIQINVDATRMSQAFTGSGYIQAIVTEEVTAFARRHRAADTPQVDLVLRAHFNPQHETAWFGAMHEVINHIALLSIILAGSTALIREREHGTIEHLLVMPVTPLEIIAAKVWAMGLVVLVATMLSLSFVVQGVLGVPIQGSLALFLAGAALHVFATTSMGIFLGTVARSMPQFGLLVMLVLLPLEMLSGGTTPRESMPEAVLWGMPAAPTTHFVMLTPGILFRGAVLFGYALARFRSTISQMA